MDRPRKQHLLSLPARRRGGVAEERLEQEASARALLHVAVAREHDALARARPQRGDQLPDLLALVGDVALDRRRHRAHRALVVGVPARVQVRRHDRDGRARDRHVRDDRGPVDSEVERAHRAERAAREQRRGAAAVRRGHEAVRVDGLEPLDEPGLPRLDELLHGDDVGPGPEDRAGDAVEVRVAVPDVVGHDAQRRFVGRRPVARRPVGRRRGGRCRARHEVRRVQLDEQHARHRGRDDSPPPPGRGRQDQHRPRGQQQPRAPLVEQHERPPRVARDETAEHPRPDQQQIARGDAPGEGRRAGAHRPRRVRRSLRTRPDTPRRRSAGSGR